MYYDNMVRRNKELSREKTERALTAIRTLLWEKEPVCVAVLVQKRVCENRVREHIGFPDLADHVHEDLLTFDQFFNVVDGKSPVWEDGAAEKGFQIGMVEDRNICKGGLVSHVFRNRSHRSCQSCHRIPASANTRSDCPIFQAEDLSPLFQCMYFAIHLDIDISACVVALVFLGHPPAVHRIISLIHINSI